MMKPFVLTLLLTMVGVEAARLKRHQKMKMAETAALKQVPDDELNVSPQLLASNCFAKTVQKISQVRSEKPGFEAVEAYMRCLKNDCEDMNAEVLMMGMHVMTSPKQGVDGEQPQGDGGEQGGAAASDDERAMPSLPNSRGINPAPILGGAIMALSKIKDVSDLPNMVRAMIAGMIPKTTAMGPRGSNFTRVADTRPNENSGPMGDVGAHSALAEVRWGSHGVTNVLTNNFAGVPNVEMPQSPMGAHSGPMASQFGGPPDAELPQICESAMFKGARCSDSLVDTVERFAKQILDVFIPEYQRAEGVGDVGDKTILEVLLHIARALLPEQGRSMLDAMRIDINELAQCDFSSVTRLMHPSQPPDFTPSTHSSVSASVQDTPEVVTMGDVGAHSALTEVRWGGSHGMKEVRTMWSAANKSGGPPNLEMPQSPMGAHSGPIGNQFGGVNAGHGEPHVGVHAGGNQASMGGMMPSMDGGRHMTGGVHAGGGQAPMGGMMPSKETIDTVCATLREYSVKEVKRLNLKNLLKSFAPPEAAMAMGVLDIPVGNICPKSVSCCGEANDGESAEGDDGEVEPRPTRRPNPTPKRRRKRRALRFAGNYTEVVGNKKQQFLEECTAKHVAKGVECVDCRPGSIIVEFAGLEEQLDADIQSTVAAAALKLPSFDAGALVDETEPSIAEELADETDAEMPSSTTQDPEPEPETETVSSTSAPTASITKETTAPTQATTDPEETAETTLEPEEQEDSLEDKTGEKKDNSYSQSLGLDARTFLLVSLFVGARVVV